MKPLELALLVGAWWLIFRSEAPKTDGSSPGNYVYPQPPPAPDTWEPIRFGKKDDPIGPVIR